jgi:outer membrane protein assembly factor BamB
MLLFRLYAVVMLILFAMTGCHSLDDYFLGEDNTDKPQVLPPVSHPALIEKISEVSITKHIEQYIEGDKNALIAYKNDVYIGTSDGFISRYDVMSKKLIYQVKLDDGILQGPVITNNNTLIIGMQHRLLENRKLETGERLWQVKLPDDLSSLPLIMKGVVIVKTLSNQIIAYDLETGKLRWHTRFESSNIMLKQSATPIGLNDHAFLVVFSDTKLVAMEVNTGEVLWSRYATFETGASSPDDISDIVADLTLMDNTLLIAGYHNLFGLYDMTSHEFKYEKPLSTYKNMLVNNGVVYLIDSRNNVHAIELASGKQLWLQSLLKGRRLTTPIIYHGYLVVADNLGDVHLVTLKTGAFKGHYSLYSPISKPPIVTKNGLYVLTNNGRFIELKVS